MINYARERAIEILKTASTTVIATNGPSGVQVGKFPCETIDLNIYILVPKTSDHLFNIEQDERIALHTDSWELTGKCRALSSQDNWPETSIIPKTETAWYVLVKVVPSQVQVLRSDGWGPAETIDLTSLS